MNGLIKYLSNKIDVSSEVVEYILSISKEKKTQKGDILISQGDKVNFIYFVEDGCLRSFTLDKDGKEHTLQFAIKNWWISDFSAINNNNLSELSMGMSSDYEDAIKFGATSVRIGSLLFGKRQV